MSEEVDIDKLIQQAAKAGREELRQIVREIIVEECNPSVNDPSRYLKVEVRDPETKHVYRGSVYLSIPTVEDA